MELRNGFFTKNGVGTVFDSERYLLQNPILKNSYLFCFFFPSTKKRRGGGGGGGGKRTIFLASNQIGGHFFASTHARGSNNDDGNAVSCFFWFLLISRLQLLIPKNDVFIPHAVRIPDNFDGRRRQQLQIPDFFCFARHFFFLFISRLKLLLAAAPQQLSSCYS